MPRGLWVALCVLSWGAAVVTGVRDKAVASTLKQRSFGVTSCRNTKAGMWYVTDDKGTICEVNQLDPMTGCCSEGDKHSCKTCELRDKCCSTYENCVSCCLAPDNNPSRGLEADVYRALGHEETGHWTDEYEYCSGKCRTHKRVTVHENAYLSPRHHCFSESERPLVDEPDLPHLPSNVQVVAGEAGESCDVACTAKRGSCAASHFPAINSCNILRDHFNCEAACEIEKDGDHPEPHYVTTKAPKSQRPAACFLGESKVNSESSKSCEWRVNHVRRLCPCTDGSVM